MLLLDLLLTSGKYQPVDPASYIWPLVGVIVAALINVASVIVATRLAGSNSDRSLARTIEADRQGRILERQLDLYGEILNFTSARKQKRDEVLALITVNGVETIDAYDPTEHFRLIGRAEAVAQLSVLQAFEAANAANQTVTNKFNLLWLPGLEQLRTAEKFAELEEVRKEADYIDERLKLAIRSALHTGKEEMDAYAYFSRRNDVMPEIDSPAIDPS